MYGIFYSRLPFWCFCFVLSNRWFLIENWEILGCLIWALFGWNISRNIAGVPTIRLLSLRPLMCVYLNRETDERHIWWICLLGKLNRIHFFLFHRRILPSAHTHKHTPTHTHTFCSCAQNDPNGNTSNDLEIWSASRRQAWRTPWKKWKRISE